MSHALNFRLEHRHLASHERVALIFQFEPVVGLEVGNLATMLNLPRPSGAHLVWKITETAFATDHEDVVVGD